MLSIESNTITYTSTDSSSNVGTITRTLNINFNMKFSAWSSSILIFSNHQTGEDSRYNNMLTVTYNSNNDIRYNKPPWGDPWPSAAIGFSSSYLYSYLSTFNYNNNWSFVFYAYLNPLILNLGDNNRGLTVQINPPSAWNTTQGGPWGGLSTVANISININSFTVDGPLFPQSSYSLINNNWILPDNFYVQISYNNKLFIIKIYSSSGDILGQISANTNYTYNNPTQPFIIYSNYQITLQRGIIYSSDPNIGYNDFISAFT